MKKIISTFAAIAAFAALLPSCTKENFSETPEVPVVIPEGRHMVVFGTSLTKTNNDGGKMSWAEGDSVKILWAEVVGKCVSDPEKDSVAVFDTTARVDASTGSISAVVGTARDYYYAVYPHWATSTLLLTEDTADSLTVTVRSTSTTGEWNRAHYAAALTDADSKNFNFKNISNALKFTVTTPGVTEVRIVTNDGSATVGKLRFAFNGDDISNEFRNVTPQVRSIITVDGPGTYYAPVMMDAQWIEGFTIEEYAGTESAGFCYTTNGICWSRNEVYNIGTVEDHKTVPHDWFFTPDGKGELDGTSWDNAAPKEKFIELLTNGIPSFINGRNLYFAAGEYDLVNGEEASINPVFPATTSFNMMGGYPADATGTDLTGRDVEKNITKIWTSNSTDASFRVFYFTSNTKIDQVKFDGLQFGPYEIKNTNSTRGYVLYVNNGDVFQTEDGAVTFENCTFTGIEGLMNGTIDFNNPKGKFIVKNCKFNGNVNTTASGGSGTAIQIENAKKALLEGCTFDGNQASSSEKKSWGGALMLKAGDIEIKNCTFKNNTSTAFGAAIGMGYYASKVLSGPNSVAVTDCVFESNTANLGGAVNLAAGNAVFTNCTFSKNYSNGGSSSANAGGGAVSTSYGGSGAVGNPSEKGSSNVTFKDCTFSENHSYGRGGAIHHLTTGKFILDGCVFTGNYQSAAGNGGGTIFHGGKTGTGILYIANSRFEGNYCLNTGNNGCGAAIATKSGNYVYIYNTAFSAHKTQTPSKVTYTPQGVLNSFDETAGGWCIFGCSFLNNDTGASVIRLKTASTSLIANCSFAETSYAHSAGIINSYTTKQLSHTAVNNIVTGEAADGISWGQSTGIFATGSNIYGAALEGVTLNPDTENFAADVSGKTASDVFDGTPAFDSDYKIPTVAGLEGIMAPVAASTVKAFIQAKNADFYSWLEEIGAFTEWSGDNWRCGAYQK